MKKLLVIPAIMLSFCIGYNVTFATNEDTHSNAKVTQQHKIANEEIHFLDQVFLAFTTLMEMT